MLRVGIGLGDVLTLQVESLERAVDRLVHHVGDSEARRVAQRNAPQALEDRARGVVGDVPVARELVRERAHVAGPLHVVLAAQRVHPDALPADIAGRHGEIGDRHHRGRALRVLGDAEAVIDRGVSARRIEPGRLAQLLPDRRRSPPRPPRAHVRGSATKRAQVSKLAGSQRSATKALSIRPSVTTTCASALRTATFAPGRSAR